MLVDWILLSSRLLCGVRLFKTDVSELHIGPFFKDPEDGKMLFNTRIIIRTRTTYVTSHR